MVRDNEFGVTWCVKCGRLYNKPCNVKFDKVKDKIYKRFDKAFRDIGDDLTWQDATPEELEKESLKSIQDKYKL